MSWPGEKQRHAMSARGVQTKRRYGLSIMNKRPMFFDSVQDRRKVIKGIGGIHHSTWYEDVQHPIFNEKNIKKFLKEDPVWQEDEEFSALVEKYNASAAIFGKVVVFENYIPLYRIHTEEQFFTMAEPNTLYVWNMNDLSEAEFEKEAMKVKKVSLDKKIELVYDVGGA